MADLRVPGAQAFSGPDNIVMSPRGSLILCEDRVSQSTAAQNLAGLTATGELFRFCRINRYIDGASRRS